MGKVRGRKQRVEVDVKPLIFDWQLEDAQTLLLLCACGSEQNLKPDLLVHALYQQMGREELKFEEQITRLELFGKSEFGFQSLSYPEKLKSDAPDYFMHTAVCAGSSFMENQLIDYQKLPFKEKHISWAILFWRLLKRGSWFRRRFHGHRRG